MFSIIEDLPEDTEMKVWVTREKTKKEPNMRLYQKFELEEGSLSEQMQKCQSSWERNSGIVIHAPTGSGKTTFVYDVLLPQILESGQHMLILSNRIALSLQQKHKLMDLLQSPLRDRLTEKGVLEQVDFGPVYVSTYQGLLGLLKEERFQEWRKDLRFVVCDEFHFFTSDACFNSYCDTILQKITKEFHMAQRFYLSATPRETLNCLAKAEYEAAKPGILTQVLTMNTGYFATAEPHLYYYHQKASYAHCTVNFFQELEELRPKIDRDQTAKWLIFVDRKEKGKAFAGSFGERAAYLDAEHKKGAVWDTLVKEQRFEQQVLVTTSVLDNGVNVWDEAVKHVVIITDTESTFLQMLGRKRVAPGENITVWACDLDRRTLRNRRDRILRLLEWYQDYDQCDNNKEKEWAFLVKMLQDPDALTLRKLFPVTERDVFANMLAKEAMEYQNVFLSNLLSQEVSFQEAVLGWMGKELPVAKDQLETFYLEHQGKELEQEEQEQLRQIIRVMYQQAGLKEKQPARSMGYVALNNRLKEMKQPYEIIEQKKDVWELTLPKEQETP